MGDLLGNKLQDELRNRIDVVQVQLNGSRTGIDRCVAGEGNNVGIVGLHQGLAQGRPVQFNFCQPGMLEAFHQDQIKLAVIESCQDLGQ